MRPYQLSRKAGASLDASALRLYKANRGISPAQAVGFSSGAPTDANVLPNLSRPNATVTTRKPRRLPPGDFRVPQYQPGRAYSGTRPLRMVCGEARGGAGPRVFGIVAIDSPASHNGHRMYAQHERMKWLGVAVSAAWHEPARIRRQSSLSPPTGCTGLSFARGKPPVARA